MFATDTCSSELDFSPETGFLSKILALTLKIIGETRFLNHGITSETLELDK